MNGTMINYYFHCKRQCYMFAHRLNLEDNSEIVKIGKAIHEDRARNSENTEIKIENIALDKINSKYVTEVKKSDADVEASKWQLLYYLKILKDISRPVDVKDPNLKLLAERMLATVKYEQGVGIAAPQVGLNIKAIWVQRFDKEGKPFEFFVNPEIKWMSSALRLGAEGCLSIPNERGEVYRSLVIDLAYETLEGEKKRELVEGFTAVIFQHEYDHLMGRLFTERIKEQKLGTFIKADEVNKIYYQK